MRPRIFVVLILALVLYAAAAPVRAQQSLCIYTLSPSTLQFAAEGGNGEAQVVASSPDCVATVGSNNSWIKVSYSQEGERGVVKVEVEASRSGSPRKGVVMIGRTQLEIIQKGRNLITW